MNCTLHPDASSVAECAACGREMCQACQVELTGGRYCRACLEKRLTPDPAARVFPPKSRFLSFVFSFVPGVSHMYLELMQRGLSIMVLFFGVIAVATIFEAAEIVIMAAPVLFFYSMFDAMQMRRRINAGQPVVDQPLWTWQQVEEWLHLQPRQTQRLLAYALIAWGGLRLLHNLSRLGLQRWGVYLPSFSYMGFPILLIAAGLWLLSSERQVSDLWRPNAVHQGETKGGESAPRE